MRVGLFCPSHDGRICAELASWATRETHVSEHLVGELAVVKHAPLHVARPLILAQLELLEAVVMVDSDQAPELLPRLEQVTIGGLSTQIERSGGSVIDAAVDQYLGGQPARVLVGVTRKGDGHPNILRRRSGRIEEAGAGFLFVARSAFHELVEPLGGWLSTETGEDIAFSRWCWRSGVELEELRGIRMRHWPLRFDPLVWDTPWGGALDGDPDLPDPSAT